MSGHTPGPWYSDGIYIWAPKDERGLARVHGVGHGVTFAEQEANARLIAAAPELLAAARLGMEGCGDCGGTGSYAAPGHDCGGDPDLCAKRCPIPEQTQCERCDRIAAVLAKAEGRS